MPPRRARGVRPVGALLVALACSVEPPGPRPDPRPDPPPDPRSSPVEEPKDDPSRPPGSRPAEEAPLAAGPVRGEPAALDRPEGAAPGSGRPDERNGTCRLYAPRAPNPVCCATETGFDAAEAARACGFDLFLGESFRTSCGYYFHVPDGRTVWFRVAFVPEADAEAAASAFAAAMSERVQGRVSIVSRRTPGVFEVRHEMRRWTFLPGWTAVRRLAWRVDFCPDAALEPLLRTMVEAEEPRPDEPRRDLLPRAR